MNYKNFKRCVKSPKYSHFCLPCSASICHSYEEFKLTVTGLRNIHISAAQRGENEDAKACHMDFASELDYVMGITEKLEKV